MRFYAIAFCSFSALVDGLSVTSVLGAPEIWGGPLTSYEFDQPYISINVGGNIIGYTANAKTFVYSNGSTIDGRLPTPVYTQLGPSPNASDLDHCGAWLNAAWVDNSKVPPIIRGFYHEVSCLHSLVVRVCGFKCLCIECSHNLPSQTTPICTQEWQCDYAHNFMTNKSIAYCESNDGGHNFTKPNHDNWGNSIIRSAVSMKFP
jgi:hypothetical protein